MKKFFVCFLVFVFTVLPVQAKMQNFGDSNFVVTRKNEGLHSRLSKEYQGFHYHIKNISGNTITIESISLLDNTSGKVAYRSMKRNSIGEMASTIGHGLAYAIPTIGLSFIGSVFLAPVKAVVNTFGNVGAKMEGKRYDKTLTLQIFRLEGSEDIEVKAISAKGVEPTMTIVYLDPVTNEPLRLICK
ncbi:hypothetical protein J6A64_07375 [bacterium]|nr:hypothetical protein [bacterium]